MAELMFWKAGKASRIAKADFRRADYNSLGNC